MSVPDIPGSDKADGMKGLSTAFLFVALLSLSAASESLWVQSNLFSNQARVTTGDILKIRFHDRNMIRYKSQLKAGNTRDAFTNRPGTQVFSFLPDFDFSASDDENRSVEYETTKEFNISIAVRVTGLEDPDILLVQGTHTVVLNGQRERILIQGLVSRRDVYDNNLVYSTDIANLQLNYEGPGYEDTNRLAAADLVFPPDEEPAADAAAGGDEAEAAAPAARPALRITDQRQRELMLEYLNSIAAILFR